MVSEARSGRNPTSTVDAAGVQVDIVDTRDGGTPHNRYATITLTATLDAAASVLSLADLVNSSEQATIGTSSRRQRIYTNSAVRSSFEMNSAAIDIALIGNKPLKPVR